MRLEQQVGRIVAFTLSGARLRSRLRMRADIGVRPAKPAFLHADDNRWQPVTKTIAFLHQRIKIAGLRIECERRRVTRAGQMLLIGAVRIEGWMVALPARLQGYPKNQRRRTTRRSSIDHDRGSGDPNDAKHPFFGGIGAPEAPGTGLRSSGGT